MSGSSIIAAASKRNVVTYFAYGSNLLTKRLRARVPSARPVARARLTGHRMEFAKRSSKDGSAKCTIIRASERHTVHGVVFKMLAAEKQQLDRIEGLGYGYEELTVSVASQSERLTAFTYIALPERLDFALKPFDWYRDLVLWGAREHALPSAWVESIASTEAVSDPDVQRVREHRAILPQAPPHHP